MTTAAKHRDQNHPRKRQCVVHIMIELLDLLLFTYPWSGRMFGFEPEDVQAWLRCRGLPHMAANKKISDEGKTDELRSSLLGESWGLSK